MEHPQAHLLLLGDFNALTPADEHVDVAGILRGVPDNSRARLMARDVIDPDLIDLTRRIPARQRYSYIFRTANRGPASTVVQPRFHLDRMGLFFFNSFILKELHGRLSPRRIPCEGVGP